MIKLHLAITVVATQLTALWKGELRYFPIEFSSLLLSGPIPEYVFKVGTTTLLITIIYEGYLNETFLALWVGMMMVAFFPGDTRRKEHMSGVLFIFAAAMYHIFMNPDRPFFVLCVAGAVLLFISRPFIVVAALKRYDAEFNSCVSEDMGWDKYEDLKNARISEIIWHGSEAFAPEHVGASAPMYMALRLCGVVQWMAFFILASIFF